MGAADPVFQDFCPGPARGPVAGRTSPCPSYTRKWFKGNSLTAPISVARKPSKSYILGLPFPPFAARRKPK